MRAAPPRSCRCHAAMGQLPLRPSAPAHSCRMPGYACSAAATLAPPASATLVARLSCGGGGRSQHYMGARRGAAPQGGAPGRSTTGGRAGWRGAPFVLSHHQGRGKEAAPTCAHSARQWRQLARAVLTTSMRAVSTAMKCAVVTRNRVGRMICARAAGTGHQCAALSPQPQANNHCTGTLPAWWALNPKPRHVTSLVGPKP
jgi:hypothetical protein